MKIVIFGSTGATGLQLVDQALAAGHTITAFARKASALSGRPAALRIVEGDVLDPRQVEAAVAGQDAVLSALGAAGKIRICAPGIANILAAMKGANVSRLIVLSSFGAAESRGNGLYSKAVRWSLGPRMEDKDEMERLIRASDVEWTMIRAPALTNGKASGKYRLGANIPVHLWSNISRANVAHAMLKELAAPKFVRKAPTIVTAK